MEEPLPNYIYHVVVENKLAGYYVDGLVDNNDDPIPRKYFYEHKNNWNLDHAKKYIQNVDYIKQNNIKVSDWDKIDVNIRRTKTGFSTDYLPKNIQLIMNKNKNPIGYKVDSLLIPDEKGKKRRYNKWFGNKKFSMDEKYDMAIKHLQEVKTKYNLMD